MRMTFAAVIATFGLLASAMGQTAGDSRLPREIGNRANGRDYQPTPQEVVPRERAAGIRPTESTQDATNRDLERMDRELLRSEGLSTKSVPKLSPDQ